jgi:hypothetical protein
MGISREGWRWTAADGLQPGLQTQAVIEPAQQLDENIDVYDAIVIGAGYTGLTATRELTISGKHRLGMKCEDWQLIVRQDSRLCYWKGEIALAAEHGRLMSTDTLTRWAVPGSTGSNRMSTESCPGMAWQTS